MSKKQVRIKTNQPGVYQNQQTGKYDVKYCYTEYDPTRDVKCYKAKWVYGINSYQTAVNTLAKMKAKKVTVNREYSCHSFRHTYISNLIRQCVPIAVIERVSGDTQETILKRYSHMFKGDEGLALEALRKIELKIV